MAGRVGWEIVPREPSEFSHQNGIGARGIRGMCSFPWQNFGINLFDDTQKKNVLIQQCLETFRLDRPSISNIKYQMYIQRLNGADDPLILNHFLRAIPTLFCMTLAFYLISYLRYLLRYILTHILTYTYFGTYSDSLSDICSDS